MVADLHCHTRLSDGSLGIEELIILAKNRGIETIAITDHDCMAATVRGKLIGERHGVTVIPGVELSAVDPARERKVHLLCYLAEFPDRLEGLCKRTSLARRKAGQYMAMRTAKKFAITPDFVLRCAAGSTNIYKQHIMHALMDTGYTNSIFGELFDKLFVTQGEDNIHVDTKYPDWHEVLEAIHDAGGIAVLAHPYTYDSIALMEELAQAGLDGVEVYHPSADQAQRNALIDFAKQHGMIVTGGSDFHGMYGSRQICIGDCGIEQEHVDALLGYKAKQRRLAKKAEREAKEQHAG